LSDETLIGEFVQRIERPVNIAAVGVSPLARLAQLGVRRISFAAFLMNQVYRAHQAKLSELAADVAGIG
jgi:2-methylisocitrate lyase-like PEP mutase family enzyme